MEHLVVYISHQVYYYIQYWNWKKERDANIYKKIVFP